MRLRLPMIGHGLGPGGGVCRDWHLEVVILLRKISAASHAVAKTTQKNKGSIIVIVFVFEVRL